MKNQLRTGTSHLSSIPDRVQPPLNRVYQNPAGLEQAITRPSADKVYDPTTRRLIILGVNIKESDFLDTLPSGILLYTGDIQDAQAGAVVALVDKVAFDVLVMVDTADGGFVVSCLLRGTEVSDVPDVRDWESVCSQSGAVVLVVLVVHDQVLLPVLVKDAPLVGVRCSLVGGDGDDAGIRPVGHVVDGEGVLVVPVADVSALEFLVGASIHETLGIVHIAVLGVAPGADGLGGVGEVDENEARSTFICSWAGTYCYGEFPLGVGDDVVGSADGEAVKVPCDFGLGVKDLWNKVFRVWVDSGELYIFLVLASINLPPKKSYYWAKLTFLMSQI